MVLGSYILSYYMTLDAALAQPSTTRPLRGGVDDVHGEDSVVDERADELVHLHIVSCSDGELREGAFDPRGRGALVAAREGR